MNELEKKKNTENISEENENSLTLQESKGAAISTEKKSRFYFFLKIFFFVLVFLIFTLVFIFYIPPVQKFIIDKTEKIIEEKSGLDISLGSMHIGFPFDLNIKDFLLLSSQKDTLIYSHSLQTNVPLLPLVNGQIDAKRLRVENLFVSIPNKEKTLRIGGEAEYLDLSSISVNLQKEEVDVGDLIFKNGGFRLHISNVAKNKNKKKARWDIAVGNVNLDNVFVSIEIPPQKVFVNVDVKKGRVEELSYNVKDLLLLTGPLSLDLRKVSYAQDLKYPNTPYIDYIHLYGEEGHVVAKNFYQQDATIQSDFTHLSLKERAGAIIQDFKGKYSMTKDWIDVQDFEVKTEKSQIAGSFHLPLTIFTKRDSTAVIEANLTGEVSDEDVFSFSSFNIRELIKNTELDLFERPVSVLFKAKGTINNLKIEELFLSSPNIFNLSIGGNIGRFFTPKKMFANLGLKTEFLMDAQKLTTWILGEKFRKVLIFPTNSQINSEINIAPQKDSFELFLTGTDLGLMKCEGEFSRQDQSYVAKLNLKDLDLEKLLPSTSIGKTSLNFELEGKGYDFRDKSTIIKSELKIPYSSFRRKNLKNISFGTSFFQGILLSQVESYTDNARLSFRMNAKLDSVFSGDYDLKVDTLALQPFAITDEAFSLSGILKGSFKTNFGEFNELKIKTEKANLTYGEKGYTYKNLQLKTYSERDSLGLILSAQDLALDMYVGVGIDSVASILSDIRHSCSELKIDSLYTLSIARILDRLPAIGIDLNFDKKSPFQKLLYKYNLSIDKGNLLLVNRKDLGLDVEANLYGIRKKGIKVDNIYATLTTANKTKGKFLDTLDYSLLKGFLWEDSQPLHHICLEKDELDKYFRLGILVNKKKYLDQEPFSFYLKAISDFKVLDLETAFGRNDQKLYALSALLFHNFSGIGFSFKDNPQIVSAYTLYPNKNNALFYNFKKREVLSNLEIITQDSASFSVRTPITDLTKEITPIEFRIKDLHLSDISSLLNMSSLEGTVFSDIRIDQDDNFGFPRCTGDISVNQLAYNSQKLGDIAFSLFYEPKNLVSHYFNTHFYVDGNPSINIEGEYNNVNKANAINLKTSIINFPIAVLNPFIGSDLMSLKGRMKGDIKITGDLQNILLNGYIHPKEVSCFLPMVGNNFVMKSEPVFIKNSYLLFKDFSLQKENTRHPFFLNGKMKILSPDALALDLKLKGENVELVNSSRKRNQMFYGRLLSTANLKILGSLKSPKISGDIDILGGTNFTYVYSNSGVKEVDNMSEVVSFVEFDNPFHSSLESLSSLSLGAIDIGVNLHIDPSVALGIDLSQGHKDYISFTGGGNLFFNYPPFGNMSLIGQYKLTGGGKMRYSFPLVGRKEFKIDPSSYLSWNGDVFTPYINFLAKQRINAKVADVGDVIRKTDFEVLIDIKDSFDNLDLALDLKAPSDISIQEYLSSMNREERGKQATELMLTGTFISANATPTTVQKVLADLAVNELNNIAGRVLQGSDFDFGMELHDKDASGAIYTSYSYNYSKSILKERLTFSIGGKFATGNLPPNYKQTFIDNIEIKWKLDNVGEHYLKGFYKRNNDYLFDGLVQEYGVGYLWRRKFSIFFDLFDIKKRSKEKDIDEKEKKNR